MRRHLRCRLIALLGKDKDLGHTLTQLVLLYDGFHIGAMSSSGGFVSPRTELMLSMKLTGITAQESIIS